MKYILVCGCNMKNCGKTSKVIHIKNKINCTNIHICIYIYNRKPPTVKSNVTERKSSINVV